MTHCLFWLTYTTILGLVTLGLTTCMPPICHGPPGSLEALVFGLGGDKNTAVRTQLQRHHREFVPTTRSLNPPRTSSTGTTGCTPTALNGMA